MLTAPVVDRTTADPPASPDVTIVPAWAPVALTARGTAACRLSEFTDAWAELTVEDKAWFCHWLADLFADAFLEEPAPTA